MSMRERALGSFFSGTFLIPLTITRKIIQKINMMMSAPKGLTSASGIDAVTHDLEAYASMLSTDYTDGLAEKAIELVFNYLPII